MPCSNAEDCGCKQLWLNVFHASLCVMIRNCHAYCTQIMHSTAALQSHVHVLHVTDSSKKPYHHPPAGTHALAPGPAVVKPGGQGWQSAVLLPGEKEHAGHCTQKGPVVTLAGRPPQPAAQTVGLHSFTVQRWPRRQQQQQCVCQSQTRLL
jgi:hypothetical protein